MKDTLNDWFSLPAAQTQNHGANRRAAFLPSVHTKSSSSNLTPARPKDPTPKTVLMRQKAGQKTPSPNKTRSNFQMLFFGLVFFSFSYAPFLWHTGKSINMWHMPLHSVNPKSSTSVLVVVSTAFWRLRRNQMTSLCVWQKKTQRKSHAVEYFL